ncbi:MAG: Ig-like domain-containing protein, partial [Bacteroidia bacterium]|nr:Ig-like domain-containing protein [Bacteroidia bacterium]
MRFIIVLLCVITISCKKDEQVLSGPKSISLIDLQLDGRAFSYSYAGTSITPEVVFNFSEPIDSESLKNAIVMGDATTNVLLNFELTRGDSTVTVRTATSLKYLTSYSLQVSSLLTSSTKK